MRRRLLLMIASAGSLAVGLNAQQPTPNYLVTHCVKVAPGKSAEFRQFQIDTAKKMAEARVKAGEIVSWTFSRSILPAGDEARCDYTIAEAYEGASPRPIIDMAGLASWLDRAGVKMTAAQWVAKRDSLSHRVAMEMWRPRERVGKVEKGNYYFLNHMRVHDAAEYTKFEAEVWCPLAEEWIKEGSQSGWRTFTLLLPAGTDAKYTALSVDIYPTWEAVFKTRNVQETFAKVHPGKDYTQVMGGLTKLRDLAQRDLMYVEEVMTK